MGRRVQLWLKAGYIWKCTRSRHIGVCKCAQWDKLPLLSWLNQISKNISPPLPLCLLFHICHLEALYTSEHMKQNMIGGFYHTSLHLAGVTFLPVSAVSQCFRGTVSLAEGGFGESCCQQDLWISQSIGIVSEKAETATCLFFFFKCRYHKQHHL